MNSQIDKKINKKKLPQDLDGSMTLMVINQIKKLAKKYDKG
jgi:hypothetical protein